MTEITTEDVLDVLDTEEAISKTEIITACSDVDIRCSECGSLTTEFKQTRESVDRALRRLLGKSKIVSTPDWNYRLARRADD